MSKSSNYYDVKQLNKDIQSFKKKTQKIVNDSVARVISGTTSEDAFTFSFDETESIPFGVSGPGQGTVVVTASTEDPVALEEQLTVLAQQSLAALEQDITDRLRGIV